MSKWLVVLHGFERGKRPKKVFEIEAANPVAALHQALPPQYTDRIESSDKVDVYQVTGAKHEYELQEHWGETS